MHKIELIHIRAAAHLILALLLAGCSRTDQKTQTHFTKIEKSVSGIDFSNTLTETSDFNIIQYLYFYNGGGVAIGDINNDGLSDIYFSSNQERNRLYLNRGNFHFEDITDKAGVSAKGNWKTGVAMADVNGDGFLDIFSCGVGNYKNFNGQNQLFINNGDETFTDYTFNSGLSFQGFSTHVAFLDYDLDGDLDMYLLNHSVHSTRSYGDVSLRKQTDILSGDKLYRNELVPSGKLVFTEVTKEAGIHNSQIGYGLGIGVSDLNLDGYPDIYVSNDFHENDYLYINKKDGTFQQVIEQSVKHSSRFSMGNDIADINNDGRPDFITLDMLPRNEGIIKASAGEDPYEIFRFKLGYGYHAQLARNALQLNIGFTDHNIPLYSDIALLAGVEATDWSWAALLADFDNDGLRDLYIANGIVRRPNDLDYINYISSDSVRILKDDSDFIRKMPDGKVPNVFFKNQGSLAFSNESEKYFGKEASLSNGAAYSDLDNDGDLDLVVNNLNNPASVYRNNSATDSLHFIRIKLEGNGFNTSGIGTKIHIYTSGRLILQEQYFSRGWQSSVDPVISVGLGKVNIIDSMYVIWPGNKIEKRYRVKVNQELKIKETDAKHSFPFSLRNETTPVLTKLFNISYRHQEDDYSVFNSERFIPHMFTTQGPSLSIADIDGDHDEDVFIGGGRNQPGKIFIQDRNNSFRELTQPDLLNDARFEDVTSVFADINGDGLSDLVVGSGGQQSETEPLALRIYVNNGKGIFKRHPQKFEDMNLQSSCLEVSDFDGDGDLDLFAGSRVIAGQYGKNPKSYLFENDGKGNFRDVSKKFRSGNEFGMVSDAAWIDLNADTKPDLVIVGEWMPVTVMIQQKDGTFLNETERFGLKNTNGWWNTIHRADMDNDGDADFLVGNLGLNSRLRASLNEPVSIYITDMDGNGSDDPVITYYNEGKQYPFLGRDQLIKQVPSMKKKFIRYTDYKDVTIDDILPADKRTSVMRKDAYILASVLLENQNGKLVLKELPKEVQAFPVFAFETALINNDSLPDIFAAGNLHAVQPDYGQYDAGYGVVLLNEGERLFKAIDQSGFIVKGEARNIQTLFSAKNERWCLVTQNNDSLLVFKIK